MIAGELIARGMHLAEPGPMFEASQGSFARMIGADRVASPSSIPAAEREMLDESRRLELDRMLALRARQGRRAELGPILDELGKLLDAAGRGKPEAEKRDLESERLDARAVVAEAEGRKADALALALAARAGREGWQEADTATVAWSQANPVRLWRELGGTPDGWAALIAGTSKPETRPSGWAAAKPEPFPAFTLQDLSGRTWRSTELRGKTLFVSFWATWCKPCLEELPHLETLAAALRGRKDVVVLSFNVDEEVGLVAPAVERLGIKVPVLLAGASLKALVSRGIPYNVIVDKRGRARFELLGMDERADWVREARGKLDAAAR